MLTVTHGDLTFDVHEHGSADGVPVLLLHGFPQRDTAWDAGAERLAPARPGPGALTAAMNWYRALPTRPFPGRSPPAQVPSFWSDGDTAVTRQSTELTHIDVTCLGPSATPSCAA